VLKEHNPEQGISATEKADKEKCSAKELFELLPSKKRELIKLSNELFEDKTKEAIFVNDMDRLEACLQAFYYTKHSRCSEDLSEFFIYAKKELRTKSAKRLLGLIEAAYNELKTTD
jgi:5'-deoxynucleotidase YfbR-like HD superfamily hydrolase